MYKQVLHTTKDFYTYCRQHFLELVFLAVAILLTFTFSSYVIIQRYDTIVTEQEFETTARDEKIAIIFGGGIRNGQPLPLLKDRLDTGYQLLSSGKVKKLILSGDNRSLNYNEPAAMFYYLVTTYNVSPDSLQADFAGRSTYETCERAKKVFGLTEAVLVSESTHLPRALYLCEQFGIKATGVKSNATASRGLQLGQHWREVLARNKAIVNIYIIGEQTILGEPIAL